MFGENEQAVTFLAKLKEPKGLYSQCKDRSCMVELKVDDHTERMFKFAFCMAAVIILAANGSISADTVVGLVIGILFPTGWTKSGITDLTNKVMDQVK